MPVEHSRSRIGAQMTALGLASDALVMVHASLRKLGPVEGGATGVIEAILDTIGPGGTMLMMVAADDDDPFDRLETEADPDNGVMAEVFRTHPGVDVNDHPACRFAAIGPLARELLEPQPLHDYYGDGSPLDRFHRLGGLVLRLGSDVDTVTLTHLAENRVDLPRKRRVRRRYVRAGTGPVDIDSIDDSDGIARWPHGDYFGQILVDFVAQNRAAVGPVGDCRAELLDGRAFVAFAIEWMKRELVLGAARLT